MWDNLSHAQEASEMMCYLSTLQRLLERTEENGETDTLIPMYALLVHVISLLDLLRPTI
jgi:hypothetical protein